MFAIKFADLTIDDISDWNEDIPSRVQPESFPRRHGAIAQQLAFLGPRTISVSGKLFKDDEASLKSYLNALAIKLTDRGRDKLYLRDDNRYLNAIKTGFGYRLQAGPAHVGVADFSIQFFADDPFWYDGQSQSQLESAVASSPHQFSLTNNGGTKTPALIEIKAVSGDITDVKLTNTTTGLWIRYSGTIQAGSTLSIDCADFLAIVNGANALPLITGTLNMHLEAGVNNFTYEGPTTVDINIVWLERWI